MRVLVAVTRREGEFGSYWNGDEGTSEEVSLNNGDRIRQKVHGDSERKLLLLDGGNTFSGLSSYADKYFGELVGVALTKIASTSDEVGVIAHGTQTPNLLGVSHRIAFSRPYTTTDSRLCVLDFKATPCKGTLPLDRLRDSILPNCNKQAEFEAAFDAVWSFFLGDPYLEAALEILHACLTPEGRATVSWDEKGQISIPRNCEGPFIGSIPNNSGKAEFETLKGRNDGPFGEGYVGALTALRDKLLKDYE